MQDREENIRMSIWVGIVLDGVAAVILILGAIVTFKKKEKLILGCGIIAAVIPFIISLVCVELPTPEITRKEDYSAIVLTASKGVKIEYQIRDNGKEEWVKYQKPFKVKQNTIVYARTYMFWHKSQRVYRNVFVEDNGLIDFGGADIPKKSLKQLKASYTYKDPQDDRAGNYYAGCEIAKNDIQVNGTDLDGNTTEVTDFTYSPQILQSGKNDIKISYTLVNGATINTHLYIEATQPKIIRLKADCKEKTWFSGVELSNDDLTVKGTYEDGTEKEVTGYALSETKIKQGKNKIVVTKDGLSVEVIINAVDKDSITEEEKENNDDINTANDIEINVRYTGRLQEEGDADYYKIQLEKKGKIVLRFKHAKIDSGYTYWQVYLLGMDETEKTGMDVTGEQSESVSSAVRVVPGTYYVRVTSNSYSDEKYILTVEFQEEGEYYETEPNDDLTQAMVIKTNKTYTGNLTESQDEDCFQFSLKEKRKVRIVFSHAKQNSDYTFWNVSLLGESDGALTEIQSTGLTAKQYSDYVRLPAGNYYIRIVSNSWSDIDYSIRVITQQEKTKTEDEDNDDYGSATKIALGTRITGNIQSDSDVDFYKFILKKRTNVKVTFTHNPADSNYTFWQITLYSEESGDGLANNDGDSVVYIQGNSRKNITSTWKLLPAGTYYIKVEDNSYNNDDYKLKIS